MSKKSTTTSKSKRSVRPANTNHRPAEQAIAVRAYEIFLSRGATNGHALDDWLQAERELMGSEEEALVQTVGVR
jgi:hypothetical protein